MALIAILAIVACGDGGASGRRTPTPTDIEETPPPFVATATPAEPPVELRVAYVNLGSPIVVDENDRVAAETYEARLEILIDELKTFRPDIVGVSEATWTPDTGQAWATLASGLGMEAQFGRANPWYPGQDQAASDQTRDLVGFEEGDAVLSRFPILEGSRIPLNPRTSESEGRAALRVKVLVPGIGEVDVYVARLSGDTTTRERQAINLSLNIELTRGTAPGIVMTDLGFQPGTNAVQLFSSQRYFDAASAADDQAGVGTCCRAQLLIPASLPTATAGSRPTPQPGASPSPDASLTPTVGSEAAPMVKTLYIFSDRWRALEFRLIGDEPEQQPSGAQLYASDHNGIAATLSLDVPGIAGPAPGN